MRELEKKFISKLCDTGDISQLIELGFKKDWLFSKDACDIYDLILEYYNSKDRVPSRFVLNELCGFEACKTELDLEDYILGLKQEYIKKRCSLLANELKQSLQDFDFDSAKNKTYSVLDVLSGITEENDDIVDIRHNAVDRYDLYLKKQSGEYDVYGVPLPWDELTEVTMGVRPGNFWMIAAKSGTGKTFLTILMADKAWITNHSILFISLEMSTYEIIERWDALHAGISLRGLSTGSLPAAPDNQERIYFENLQDMENLPPAIIVGNSKVSTPVDIEFLIKKYNPDIVFVDSIYNLRMKDRHYRADHESIAECSRYIQQMTKRLNVPLVGSGQFQRKGIASDDVAHTIRFLHDSHCFIGLYRDDEMFQMNEAVLKVLKNRVGNKIAFRTKWDIDNCDFSFIEEVDFDN